MSPEALPDLTDLLSAGAMCTRIVSTVEVGTTLETAARVMRETHVGCVVVVDELEGESRVAGVLTDRDITVSAVALGLDARVLRAGDLMTRDVVTVREDDPLGIVLDRMRERGIRRVPVVSPTGGLVGLVSFDDLQAALFLQVHAMTEVLVAGRMNEVARRA
ncbi:MAG TPA: CBS domain-containing protein [Burkholderiaceae bacterium]